MFLYVVTNLVNGKRYVGIAKDYIRRWREHRSGHGSKLVYHAIKKYGIENLDFQVICKGTEEYVKEMEVRAIRMLNTMAHSGYNLTEGGEGSTGWKASDETRRRMCDSHTGTTGYKFSDDAKQKMREARLKYKRGKHPRATRIVVDDIQYECLRDAADDIGIPYSTFCTKQRSTKSTTFTFQPKGVLTPVTAY
jgi:group I intron endonuclease